MSRYALLISSLFLLDIASKELVWRVFEAGQYPVLGSWLFIHPVHNPGMAFSIGSCTDEIVLMRCLVMLCAIAVVTFQHMNKTAQTIMCVALAGGLGNLYDNLSRWMPWPGNGFVRDFIRVDLGIFPFNPWPTFNVADIYLTVAFALFLVTLLLSKQNAPPASSRA